VVTDRGAAAGSAADGSSNDGGAVLVTHLVDFGLCVAVAFTVVNAAFAVFGEFESGSAYAVVGAFGVNAFAADAHEAHLAVFVFTVGAFVDVDAVLAVFGESVSTVTVTSEGATHVDAVAIFTYTDVTSAFINVNAVFKIGCGGVAFFANTFVVSRRVFAFTVGSADVSVVFAVKNVGTVKAVSVVAGIALTSVWTVSVDAVSVVGTSVLFIGAFVNVTAFFAVSIESNRAGAGVGSVLVAAVGVSITNVGSDGTLVFVVTKHRVEW
jgi:hypothetical protein